MGLVENFRFENAGLMFLETSAQQRDKPRIIAKTGTGTMDRQETVAALDKIPQCHKLLWFDGVVVGVKHQSIVVTERFGIQAIGLGEIVEVDCLATHGAHQQGNTSAAVVVFAFVTEKQYAERTRFRGTGDSGEKDQP